MAGIDVMGAMAEVMSQPAFAEMIRASMRSSFSRGEHAAKAKKLARAAENKVMRTDTYKKWRSQMKDKESDIVKKGLLDFLIKENNKE